MRPTVCNDCEGPIGKILTTVMEQYGSYAVVVHLCEACGCEWKERGPRARVEIIEGCEVVQ